MTDLADYQPTRLIIDGDLDLPRYQELLAALGSITKGHQWWVGDALVYGEEHFDENVFVQAAETLRLEPHTLTNYRWVASAIAPSRRRETLSWSHHAEVARLDPKDQTKLLREAERRGWGVRELRDVVSIRFPQEGREPTEQPKLLTEADEATMNRRLEGIAVALDAAREHPDRWHEHFDLDDVSWLHHACVELLRGGRR